MTQAPLQEMPQVLATAFADPPRWTPQEWRRVEDAADARNVLSVSSAFSA